MFGRHSTCTALTNMFFFFCNQLLYQSRPSYFPVAQNSRVTHGRGSVQTRLMSRYPAIYSVGHSRYNFYIGRQSNKL